jgi:hypothetical protein
MDPLSNHSRSSYYFWSRFLPLASFSVNDLWVTGISFFQPIMRMRRSYSSHRGHRWYLTNNHASLSHEYTHEKAITKTMLTTTMTPRPRHRPTSLNKPAKQAQSTEQDLTSVTYTGDDSTSSLSTFQGPILREVSPCLTKHAPHQPQPLTNGNTDSDSDDSSVSTDSDSDSDDSSPENEFDNEFDNFAKGDNDFDVDVDMDEASEINSQSMSVSNPSVCVSTASAPAQESQVSSVGWNAAESIDLDSNEQEDLLENMVRKLTLKLAKHQETNERYVSLFSNLEDTQDHIQALNQRAKVLEQALSSQNVRGLGRARTVPISPSNSLPVAAPASTPVPAPVPVPFLADTPVAELFLAPAPVEPPTRQLIDEQPTTRVGVQPENSNTSMEVVVAGETIQRKKLVRKVRMVPRKKPVPVEYDLSENNDDNDDEASFHVQVPVFHSPKPPRSPNKKSPKKLSLKMHDIPRNLVLQVPFPEEEKLASPRRTPRQSPKKSALNKNKIPRNLVLAVPFPGDEEITVNSSSLGGSGSAKGRSSSSDPMPLTPATRRRRLANMTTMVATPDIDHNVANKEKALNLKKTASMRSFFKTSQKILSARCLRPGDGFLSVHKEDTVSASFFGLGGFDELASRPSSEDSVSRRTLETAPVAPVAAAKSPPLPAWMHSKFNKSEPALKANFFEFELDNDNSTACASGRPLLR